MIINDYTLVPADHMYVNMLQPCRNVLRKPSHTGKRSHTTASDSTQWQAGAELSWATTHNLNSAQVEESTWRYIDIAVI